MAFLVQAIQDRMTPRPNQERVYVKLLPIKVEAVLECGDDVNLRSIIDMRNFCKEKQIEFETRLYNSRKNNYDCEFIERLPAFHMYEKKNYVDTFYPGDYGMRLVAEHVSGYKIRKAEKARRKNRWSLFVAWLQASYEAATKRETALERARRLAGPQHSAVGHTFVNLTVEQMPRSAAEWS
jgi:hypothetical protein